ncbi:hypothetical protein AVEN_41258-1, partial [Araneus ventricosus]
MQGGPSVESGFEPPAARPRPDHEATATDENREQPLYYNTRAATASNTTR